MQNKDAKTGSEGKDKKTPGGAPPEPVEDRPRVGEVEPDDYPKKDREDDDLTSAP